jgi:hypothetical protein
VSALLKARPRTGTLLLGLAVAVVAIASIVNGVSEVKNSHGTKRDLRVFNNYLRDNVGPSGFGRPRVKLHAKRDSVCATHRAPDYQLCLSIRATSGQIASAYKVVRGADGRPVRQPFQP